MMALLTHARRMLWSSSDMYASKRSSSGSSTGVLAFSVTHFCSLPEGTTCGWSRMEALAPPGNKNGSAPLGEAWLLDATVAKSTRLNFKYACGQRLP